MEEKSLDSAQKLMFWGAAIVGVHFVVVVWHLKLVVNIQPEFPRLAVPFLILVNLLPVGGFVALAKGYTKLAGILIIVPLATALALMWT